MSRRVLIVAVVVATILASLIVPSAARPLEISDGAESLAVAWTWLSRSSPATPLPILPDGDGGCVGAGACPT